MNESYYVDGIRGTNGPPNPEGLTDTIETQDDGNRTTIDSGGAGPEGVYGILHYEAQINELAMVPDAFPDHVTDVGSEAARSGRPARAMVPPVREYPGQQIITQSYRMGATDAPLQILGTDPDRKLARITVHPEDGTLTTVLVYISSNGSSVLNTQSGGVVRAWSAVPSSLDRVITATDGLYAVLDATSESVWIDVYVERYQ